MEPHVTAAREGEGQRVEDWTLKSAEEVQKMKA